jgi:hypothetical protein
MSTNILIIKSIVATSAAWRARVAQEYPGDARNVVAQELLKKIAADNVTDDGTAIDRYSNSEIAREATAVAKLVGFRIFPETLAAFVNDVIKRVETARTEWTHAFRDGGVR